MKKIFAGLLLICINLDLSQAIPILPTVDFLPDFIGYILLYRGIPELAGESSTLDRMRKPLIVFSVVSAVYWVTSAAWANTTSIALALLLSGLSIAALILSMYTLYQAARGYEELESVKKRGQTMRRYWKKIPYCLLLFFLFYMVLGYLTLGRKSWILFPLLLVCGGFLIAILVYFILYLVQAYRAMKEYIPAQAIVSIRTPEDL